MLLEHGLAAPGLTNHVGESALHVAAHSQEKETGPLLELLVRRGCPVDIRDHGYNTPLMAALTAGSVPAVRA